MKKKSKTIGIALLLITLLISLCACGGKSSPNPVAAENSGTYDAVEKSSDENEDTYETDSDSEVADTTDAIDSAQESTYKKPDLDIENMAAMEPLTDPNAHRFVYIPASYFGINDLYGQEAIWGYMDGDEAALAVIHVEDGDITYKNGTPLSHVNYLEPGDIVESTSVTIMSSNPAEVTMDNGIYIEAGHDVAIYPFLDLIGMEPVELAWGYSGVHENRVTVDYSR